MLLHDFLATNQAELIERCRTKVAQRSPGAATRGLQHGIAPFLAQLIKTLQLEQTPDPMQGRKVSGPAGGQIAGSEIEGTWAGVAAASGIVATADACDGACFAIVAASRS